MGSVASPGATVAGAIEQHLLALVGTAARRPPGSAANRHATDYVIRVLRAAGMSPVELPFRARHWRPGRAFLEVDGAVSTIEPPPFCRTSDRAGRAVLLSTNSELAAALPDPGAIIVVRGELAVPVFPKAFPFVSFDEHTERIRRLEALRPAAVIAIVASEAAHEPVFEDPDLDFPYATVPASLADSIGPGSSVRLVVEATIAEGNGVNVSAGSVSGPRAVVCAHVDSKVTTPGALDNGGGVAALLALAEGGLEDLRPVELVFFNGEDHYAAPGEVAWLAVRELADVELVVNIDGAGLAGYPATVSTIGAGVDLEATVDRLVDADIRLVRGEPWFESDHAVFAMRGTPSIAITSAAPFDLLKRRSHVDDAPADIDVDVLAAVVGVIRKVLAVDGA